MELDWYDEPDDRDDDPCENCLTVRCVIGEMQERIKARLLECSSNIFDVTGKPIISLDPKIYDYIDEIAEEMGEWAR